MTLLCPSPPEAPARPALIGALTGIRAMAALWVFLRHFRTEIIDVLGPGPITQFIVHICSIGYLGVDLFFILSGFILTYTHLHSMTTKYSWRKAVAFLWLRWARVWPLTTTVLMLFGAYFVFQSISSQDPSYYAQADAGRLLMHMTLLNGWFPAALDWNGVDWSVSAEWLAYLSFSIGVVALARFARVTSRRAKIVILLALMLPIIVIGFSLQDDTILLFGDNGYVTGAGVVPIRVLTEFWIGAILALLVAPLLRARPTTNPAHTPVRSRVPVPTIVVAAIVAVILAVSYADPLRNPRPGQDEFYRGIDVIAPTESIIVLPLLVLLIGSLALYPRDPLARLLSTRPLLLGGRVSFAFYLVHPLAIGFGALMIQRLGATGGPLLLSICVGTLVAAWLAAWLLWRWVEEPARRMMRRMLPSSIDV